MLFALGFVFMFTVGGLLNHLALPLKTTICWNLLTIMLLGIYLLIPVKMYNFEQSAGNQATFLFKNVLLGTSETKRGPYTEVYEDIVRVIKNSLIYLNPCILSFSNACFYSTYNFDLHEKIPKLPVKHVKIYNLKNDRIKIFKEEKEKSGIYYLINNLNGHAYVGSSINLASRMRNYLNNSFLKSKQNVHMPIVKALLKYDQSNFTLLILEYLETESLTIRETDYITLLIPYYNVLKQGYSTLGYKHTEETKKLLSILAKNRTHSDLTKSLIARALTGENNPFYNKSHSLESKIRISEAKSAYPVYVYNSFKQLLFVFPSVGFLAKLIKSNHATLVDVIKNNLIFRGEWYLSNIPYNISDTPLISSLEKRAKLVLEINLQSHIKKAVFVYNTKKNFLCKYEGVMAASRALNISHLTIKNHAKIGGIYKNYIFSYERLID